MERPFCSNCGASNHVSSYCREPPYNRGYQENYHCGWYDESCDGYQANGWEFEVQDHWPWFDHNSNDFEHQHPQHDSPFDEFQGECDFQWGYNHLDAPYEDFCGGYGSSNFPPPPQQDPSMQLILNSLQQIQNELKEQKAHTKMIETQIAQLVEQEGKTPEGFPNVSQVSIPHQVNPIELRFGKSYDGPRQEIKDDVLEIEDEFQEPEIDVEIKDEEEEALNERVEVEKEAPLEAKEVEYMEERSMPPPEVSQDLKSLPFDLGHAHSVFICIHPITIHNDAFFDKIFNDKSHAMDDDMGVNQNVNMHDLIYNKYGVPPSSSKLRLNPFRKKENNLIKDLTWNGTRFNPMLRCGIPPGVT